MTKILLIKFTNFKQKNNQTNNKKMHTSTKSSVVCKLNTTKC